MQVDISNDGNGKIDPRNYIGDEQHGIVEVEFNGWIEIDNPSEEHDEGIANHKETEGTEDGPFTGKAWRVTFCEETTALSATKDPPQNPKHHDQPKEDKDERQPLSKPLGSIH
jgi:hypothetical protein